MSSPDDVNERLKDNLIKARQEGDKTVEGDTLNELGLSFEKSKEFDTVLACYLLASNIREELKDPAVRLTQSNIRRLMTTLGGKEFNGMMKRVGPKAGKIVEEILK